MAAIVSLTKSGNGAAAAANHRDVILSSVKPSEGPYDTTQQALQWMGAVRSVRNVGIPVNCIVASGERRALHPGFAWVQDDMEQFCYIVLLCR
ncbi:MAG TPA: hypothetical protein VGM18_01045 [Candidatus Sulfotelmatobacter sp.]